MHMYSLVLAKVQYLVKKKRCQQVYEIADKTFLMMLQTSIL